MIKKLFSILSPLNLKNYGLALGLVIIGFFMGSHVGWIKALRWAAMRYELKQAKEGLRNAKAKQKIEQNINGLDDDELDKLVLAPPNPPRK